MDDISLKTTDETRKITKYPQLMTHLILGWDFTSIN